MKEPRHERKADRPAWFVLVESWPRRGPGAFGVTVPFLVGALAMRKNVRPTPAQVEPLLTEMCKSPVHGYVTQVSWCPDIEAPVLSVVAADSPYDRMSSPAKVPHPSGRGESLVFGGNLVYRWGTKEPEELLRKLRDDATEPLSLGRCSRRRNSVTGKMEYGDFSAHEIDFIRNLSV